MKENLSPVSRVWVWGLSWQLATANLSENIAVEGVDSLGALEEYRKEVFGPRWRFIRLNNSKVELQFQNYNWEWLRRATYILRLD